MAAESKQLATVRGEILDKVRQLYDVRIPVKEAGVFSEPDWNRCRAAFDLVAGPSVLEVGVGPGQMFNALARDASIRNLRGLDVVWNKKLIRPDRGELEIMNILDLQIEDASFDTVLCMEVLQHLEPIDFPKAVHELRRVSRSRLIMTVPYAEPEPVWHNDKRGGHRQSFPEEKIERFFPRAERWMIPRGRNKWSWIMLVEQPDMR